ncbi:MAG: glycoside hydrolase family 104 protein [Oscillatoriales cyanobacterium SM2_1_8]|nr:glycoside hydrolase family 104 protein [Oscillatoriales cyanobacterium SM2_1_8]
MDSCVGRRDRPGFGLGSAGRRAIAQGCFMQLSSGQYINLNDLCAKNPLPPPPPVRPASPARRSASRATAAATVYTPIAFPPSSRNLQAFLQVIRYAEGTDAGDGYQIAFTGRRFASLQDHPRAVHCSGRLCSSAAGAYQFLETTWDNVAAAIGASDFRPEWQDRAAIELIRRRGPSQMWKRAASKRRSPSWPRNGPVFPGGGGMPTVPTGNRWWIWIRCWRCSNSGWPVGATPSLPVTSA